MISLTIHTPKGALVSSVPECWDELTPEQVSRVAAILFTETDQVKKEIRLARAICGIEWSLMKRIPVEKIIEQMLPLTDFIFESCDLKEQLLPVLHKGKFCGPQGHLRNLRFNEFDSAERALHEWHLAPSFEGLCRFIAVIYRPPRGKDYDFAKDPEGDIREPYNPNLTEGFALQMLRFLTEGEAYAILLWYKGCREYICQCFPSVFDAPEANKSEIQDAPAYFGLIRAIAKEGIYGTFDDVEQMYIYNVFGEIEAAQQERDMMEEVNPEPTPES